MKGGENKLISDKGKKKYILRNFRTSKDNNERVVAFAGSWFQTSSNLTSSVYNMLYRVFLCSTF
jgi:hypothetical protein